MAVRISWDKYEAAILLDACVKVCNKEIPRLDAIKNVSEQLRQMAINKGIEIDEVYRNTNGISLQMSMMIGLVTEKETGLTAPSKIFKDIADMYKNDREAFYKILNEAKAMINNSSNDKDKFFEYVMNKEPKKASDIFLALDAVDKFAISSKAMSESFYNDISEKNIDILRRKVVGNKFFVVKNKKSVRYAELGIKLLAEFISVSKKETDNKNNAESISVKQNAANNASRTVSFSEKSVSSRESVSGGEKRLDLGAEINIAYSDPQYIILENKSKIPVKSWRDVYIKVLLYAMNEYPNNFYEGMALGNGKSVDIYGVENSSKLRRPKRISDKYYIEANLSAKEIADRLRNIIRICNIDNDDIKVYYIGDEKKSSERVERKYSQNRTEDSGSKEFFNWMMESGMSESAAKIYRAALKNCDTYAAEHNIYSGSIIDCSLYNDFMERYAVLKDNSGFKEYSVSKHRFPAAALKKYAEYMEAINLGADKSSAPAKSESNNSVSDELSDRCNAILKAEFEDGYRIGHYMHKQIFIEMYEETYGVDISDEVGDIDELLKKAGQVIDDRIFASSGKTSDSVLTDIYNDIQNTFNNGATVIYIDCVFEKYNRRLSEEMNVYSASTLKNVFAGDKNFPMGFHTDKTTIQKYGVSGGLIYEVEECLKKSHTPLSYDDLHKILWYLPIDRIKFALNHIPNAAYVDDFSYLYATNFNIPTSELLKLTTAMHNAIYSKGYLVSKDLRGIFRENCPTAAIDSEHYKDYAIREILKVLLGDKFDFTGSVISEKGKKADMSSVFREFAAEHDKLTLSQIREFADGLNVSIYWYNILEKMVRISSEELVNKNLVSFDVAATDKVLESCCTDNFVMLKDVSGYLSFPPCGYKWNGFVLESYLRDYSETFQLVQLSVSSDDFVGAMSRRSSGLERYEDVAAEVLAASKGWSDEKTALACLVNLGLQQRKTNKKISEIIKKAKNIIAEKE